MGKPFSKELAALKETYEWAREVASDPLVEFVGEAHARPLLAVGSGGSTTAAHLAALMHRFHGRAFARHTTPLEILLSEPNLTDAAVLLLSASGKNRDVLATLERCIQRDVRVIATLSMQCGSPLATTARRVERAYVFEEEVPCGKDGFLATNSLLATCILIARAYGIEFPKTFSTPQLQLSVAKLGEPSAALVLHGGWGSPVATDLESKLNESAIVSTQLSDYRNFGHGRHLWLARRASETIVITIVTPETSKLAERTRMLLPRDIPVIEIKTADEGPIGTIDLLLQSFHLVGKLGALQSFDPGRPTVPQFGRKLYHLAPSIPLEDVPMPVVRKLARMHHLSSHEREETHSAFDRFIERLRTTKLGGIVLDYDGTLCGRAERFGVLRPEIARECCRLLEGGLLIGIATGRGRSVRNSLQKTLPQSLWHHIIIGYYNGGEIALLEHNDAPVRDVPPAPPLDVARDLLEQDSLLRGLVSITVRHKQITIEPKRYTSTDSLLAYVMTLLAPLEGKGVRVLVSSHSVDVLPMGVGKLTVVDEVKRRIREGTEVLCIGDRGTWPGNDYALLSHEPSLSVDEVSATLTTCWNIAPPGLTGVDATLLYLQSVHILNDSAILDAPQELWKVS
jgi:D-arabinose 5-phosphate isomerase GutQ